MTNDPHEDLIGFSGFNTRQVAPAQALANRGGQRRGAQQTGRSASI
jgi:hypothetical protein